MKHFFLDTNIVIDVLTDRKPFSDFGQQLFDLSLKEKIKLSISSLSYTTIYYYIRKSSGSHKNAITILKELEAIISPSDVSKEMINQAIHSDFNDFEDAVQYFTALSVKCDAIITRNPKDFKKSSILILSPEEALAQIQNAK